MSSQSFGKFELFFALHKGLFEKYPCKKCLVKPMCQIPCAIHNEYKFLFYPYYNKVAANITILAIDLSVLAFIISCIKMLLKS
jgi:hypothetical protein